MILKGPPNKKSQRPLIEDDQEGEESDDSGLNDWEKAALRMMSPE